MWSWSILWYYFNKNPFSEYKSLSCFMERPIPEMLTVILTGGGGVFGSIYTFVIVLKLLDGNWLFIFFWYYIFRYFPTRIFETRYQLTLSSKKILERESCNPETSVLKSSDYYFSNNITDNREPAACDVYWRTKKDKINSSDEIFLDENFVVAKKKMYFRL